MPVLVPADSLIVVYLFTAADTGQDLRFLINSVGRHKYSNRLADRLVSGVAKGHLGTLIPTEDNAVQILADDRVI